MESTTRGFTILETVIASAILVAAATAIATLFFDGVRVNNGNRERTGATLVLAAKLEELTNFPPSVGVYAESVILPDRSALLLEWQVQDTNPRLLTITVYDATHRRALVHNTTSLARRW